jgi:hypothetical protein
MFGQKHHNVVTPEPNNAPPASTEQYLPVEPLLQRDLNARETVGLIRFVLFMVILVVVFFIGVFGVLGAIAHAVGSGLGLHNTYPDIIGTH